MRWPLLLGVLLIAIAAFFTLTWSQSASVRLQQQIMEMALQGFHPPEGAAPGRGRIGARKARMGSRTGSGSKTSVKDQGDRVK